MSAQLVTAEQAKNREALINHVAQNGRTASWHDLAVKFNLPGGHLEASNVWSNYRIKHNLPKADKKIRFPFKGLSVTTSSKAEASLKYTMDLEDKITSYEEDKEKGTAQITALVGQEIKTLDELIDKCKIDLDKWVISKWVQNFWNNKYQVKVFLSPKVETIPESFQNNFVEFLKTYTPEVVPVVQSTTDYGSDSPSCLIINKQDAHFDKHDIHGDNDIIGRFVTSRGAISVALAKASLTSKLDTIVYVIGSDEFNCEWTGMTTKGTPQKNAIGFHKGFQMICDHETLVIRMLLAEGKSVKLVYLPGNHDAYVGWHLIHWLKAYFREESRLDIDICPLNRKYMRFGNSAIMFNHGDVIKPQKLAAIFPQEFRSEWSNCVHQYIFTGDKHHEMSLNIEGIRFYQLGPNSKATSDWDDKRGYKAAGEMNSFLISEDQGITDIYRTLL